MPHIIRFVIAITILAGCHLTAAAQGPFIAPACRENCSPLDAACIAREQTCQGKLALYYSYMAQLGAGVTLYQLPQLYIDVLQPHYGGADLRSFRFGFSDRQPANNATTDCSTTYWNNRAFVDRLRIGSLTSDGDFHWLFHELQHLAQCRRVGGRDLYAKMWFSQLETTFIQNSDLATLHDRMPMEAEADADATQVLGATRANRNGEGRLVRSITLELLRNGRVIPASGPAPNLPQGVRQTITARITGFSSPPPVVWSIKRPNQVFAPATGSGPNGTELQWTPNEPGAHQIRVTVGPPGSTTESVTRTVSFNVLATGELPPGTPPPADAYETPTQVPRFQQVRLVVVVERTSNGTTPPVGICVIDNVSQEVYGRATIFRQQGAFTVHKNRQIKIIVSAGSSSGLRGESRIIQMGETEQTVTIRLFAGSGGPICGGVQ